MSCVSLSIVPVLLSYADQMIEVLKEFFTNPFGLMFGGVLAEIQVYLIDLFWAWVFRKYFKIWIAILKFIWIMEQVFDIFAGVTGVYKLQGGKYVKTSGNSNILEDQSFLDVLFNDNVVQNAYAYIMVSAFVLCFLFTIFAVIRSMGDSIAENKRPVTAVMRHAFQAGITFLLVPMACLMLLKLSSVTTYVVIQAGEEDTRVCDALYSMGVGDEFKSEYARDYFSGGRHFLESNAIDHVNYKKMNYLIAYISSLFMVVVMTACILQSVLRIMVLLVLFVVSPYFVATIPFDEGAKFNKWKKIFVGYVIAAFGPMLTMRIYLAIVPALCVGTGSITLWPLNHSYTSINELSYWSWDGETMASLAEDAYHLAVLYVMKLILLIGGAFAAWRSQYMMIQIVDRQAVGLLKRGEIIMALIKNTASKGAKAGKAAASGGASLAAGGLSGSSGNKDGGMFGDESRFNKERQ